MSAVRDFRFNLDSIPDEPQTSQQDDPEEDDAEEDEEEAND